MPWFRSPVKLFGYTALLLFLVRMVFPPANFAGALQARLHIHIMDLNVDLTGYGLFEFAAVVFLLSALAYYLLERLTGTPPNDGIVQFHFWPSLLFALFAVFIAHWVNLTPSDMVKDPEIQASLNRWLTAFAYATVGFILLQVVFAAGAIRSVWLSRNILAQS
jgi:hypothetical protein